MRLAKIIGMLCLVSALQVTHVQAEESRVKIRAGVINTNFETSVISIMNTQDEDYFISFHFKNTGDLPSKNTKLTLDIPSGWKYQNTVGETDQILSQESAHGQVLFIALPPIKKGNDKGLTIYLLRTDKARREPMYISISSEYSEVVKAKILPIVNTENSSWWMKWLLIAWNAFRSSVLSATALMSMGEINTTQT